MVEKYQCFELAAIANSIKGLEKFAFGKEKIKPSDLTQIVNCVAKSNVCKGYKFHSFSSAGTAAIITFKRKNFIKRIISW